MTRSCSDTVEEKWYWEHTLRFIIVFAGAIVSLLLLITHSQPFLNLTSLGFLAVGFFLGADTINLLVYSEEEHKKKSEEGKQK